jgi:hypothetical protein
VSDCILKGERGQAIPYEGNASREAVRSLKFICPVRTLISVFVSVPEVCDLHYKCRHSGHNPRRLRRKSTQK